MINGKAILNNFYDFLEKYHFNISLHSIDQYILKLSNDMYGDIYIDFCDKEIMLDCKKFVCFEFSFLEELLEISKKSIDC